MKNKLINIAIDGYSSCGKSSIAKSVSKEFNMKYVDSGAMYRAVTLFFMNHKIISNSKINYDKLLRSIDDIDIDFYYNIDLNITETLLNGKNVEHLIRDNNVSNQVSNISQIKEVRDKLISFQRRMCSSKNVVMDGRDIGTKVMPDADIKFFITAEIDTRARRRFDELIKYNNLITFDQILINLNKRDTDDTEREINPLVKSDDAIVIDNTSLSYLQQNQLIFSLIKQKQDENNN
ncbi:MAG: (d)CMP kinase [Flavobacteriales bacterium]|nr:(d)CMP kinase [Flavobacteriales bacterium]